VLIALSVLSFTPIENATTPSANTVQWLTWEEAMELSKENPKKILLNVYTDWCGWCKRMDTITYSDPYLATLINEHFYPVKFDAEFKEPLEYKGQVYEYTKSGKKGHHELAVELLKGRLSYPSVVFLNEDQEVIQSIVGFKTPVQFEQITTYFAEDHYLKTPWSVYQRTFEPMLIKD
jgi:thioredoxin-related protein